MRTSPPEWGPLSQRPHQGPHAKEQAVRRLSEDFGDLGDLGATLRVCTHTRGHAHTGACVWDTRAEVLNVPKFARGPEKVRKILALMPCWPMGTSRSKVPKRSPTSAVPPRDPEL